MRYWAPNQEPIVLLKCGCITLAWPVLKVIGERREQAICDNHGWQYIKRRATPSDYENCAKRNLQSTLF